MRITKEQIEAAQENRRRQRAGKWFFTGWYRIVKDGEVWMETSSKVEIEEELAALKVRGETDFSAYEHWEKHKSKWKELRP